MNFFLKHLKIPVFSLKQNYFRNHYQFLSVSKKDKVSLFS